jgi:superfamily I DNA/RNA helicase
VDFRIADTFTDSLVKLTGDEQKAVKTTAFDLQLNPANPGMQLHRVDRAKDPHFWSVRVNRDIRAIVHKSSNSLLLCYVAHHDDAYHWAERRKLERHPKTGAAQLVEIRELVQKITIPVYVEEAIHKEPARVCEHVSDDDLLAYGVPQEWVADIKTATEDSILSVVEHLPREASEAVLDLATGGHPSLPTVADDDADPFDHPDAQSRFRVMANVEELERALDFPWEKWSVFLHPGQRDLVDRTYSGAVRVSGSAGTGKTIVALHRAVHLARAHLDARVLLTTFSDPLADALHLKLRALIHNEPRLAERLEVESLPAIGKRLAKIHLGMSTFAEDIHIRSLLANAATAVDLARFSAAFLWDEWHHVVDAWQLKDWEAYRTVKRLGRKTRLAESQREALWAVFTAVDAALEQEGAATEACVFSRLAEHLKKQTTRPFAYAVIDESQDLTVAQLRFLAALSSDQPDGLFFSGDLGQRIFQQPFSWKSLGVDVRGRSHTLRVCYRTSHQIRRQADRLLPPELQDVDENAENRRGTVSVFNGKPPRIVVTESSESERNEIANWLTQLTADGIPAHEIGIFVRDDDLVSRAIAAAESAGLKVRSLTSIKAGTVDVVTVAPMHSAKGLEFRAVAVMACDDEIIPSQARIDALGDGADLEEVYNTERNLLYVACTRARDHLIVTGVDPASEFLEDLDDG